MKELKLDCYINDHLEETHESEISEKFIKSARCIESAFI